MISSNHMSQLPNGISIASAVFARHIRATNTQKGTQTVRRVTSVAIGHIYAICMRCGLKMQPSLGLKRVVRFRLVAPKARELELND